MIGPAIRKLGSWVYDYSHVPQGVPAGGPFGQLKIALVSDYFTAVCLAAECSVRCLTPANYRDVLAHWKPDLVFVESAFHGADGAWRYELARQPRWLRLRQPRTIFKLLQFARQQGIPTVFWNKDDGAFFDDFVHLAPAFDAVFTTDQDCIDKYRQHVSSTVPVQSLGIAYQPAFHHFTGFEFSKRAACFTGSYYRFILNERGQFLNTMFSACDAAGFPLNVYDRNSHRMSRLVEFRFPKSPQLQLYPRVPHPETARIYKQHVASINVNSVTGSATMWSRRLLEILACGGIVVTNRSRSVELHFSDYCHIVDTRDQATELFARLAKDGPSASDLERARAGAHYVAQHHTWRQRLEQVCGVVGV